MVKQPCFHGCIYSVRPLSWHSVVTSGRVANSTNFLVPLKISGVTWQSRNSLVLSWNFPRKLNKSWKTTQPVGCSQFLLQFLQTSNQTGQFCKDCLQHLYKMLFFLQSFSSTLRIRVPFCFFLFFLNHGMVSFLSEASSVQGSETHNKANCKAFQLVKLPREGQQA